MTTTDNSTQGAQQPDASGSNGGQQTNMFGNMDPAMMQILFPEMFPEPIRESLYEDAVMAGAVIKGKELEIGVFSIMVYAADATHPKAEMVVRSNGAVVTTQERLKKLGDFFIRMSRDQELREALQEAEKTEEEAVKQNMANSLAQGALKGGI